MFVYQLNYMTEHEVVYELPLNRLDRSEWNNILWYLQQKIAADWLQNQIDSKRSHPA